MEWKRRSLGQWILLILSCVALAVGGIAGTMLIRFYFLHGGNRIWLCSFLQTAGCPLLLLPIWIASRSRETTHLTPNTFLASTLIGVLTGLDNFFYSWGLAYLPLSTSALVIAPQLAFNAFFAYLLLKQKFTPYSINAIVLLTMGAAMLGFHASSDRPNGVTSQQYRLGLFAAAGAAALYGLILPLIELVYKKTRQRITYGLVMEMQFAMSLAASVVTAVGMIVNKDFPAVVSEARESDVGEVNYYVSLVWNTVSWQVFLVGLYGVIFLASSLWSAVLMSSLTPLAEGLAVLIFHEKFTAEKGMALAMAMWGFTSYFYGEYKKGRVVQEQRQGGETASLEMVVAEPKFNGNRLVCSNILTSYHLT